MEIEKLMDKGATILGALAAISSTIAFVPQITKIWKTGGKDVSYSMLSLYVAGVTLWLCYGLVIGATGLSLANAASIVFAGTCLVLKVIKEKQTASCTLNKRLRIAIDMDETIADSLKEHIRRYNAASIGILFSAPHNLQEEAYERVSNWRDIRRRFSRSPQTVTSMSGATIVESQVVR